MQRLKINITCTFGSAKVSEAHASVTSQLLSSDLLTIIITTADYGCDLATMSVPGTCAPDLLPADQEVHGGVCPAMPYHDGAGLKAHGPCYGTGPLFILLPPED